LGPLTRFYLALLFSADNYLIFLPCSGHLFIVGTSHMSDNRQISVSRKRMVDFMSMVLSTKPYKLSNTVPLHSSTFPRPLTKYGIQAYCTNYDVFSPSTISFS
jgi:hypothetical protein